MKGIKRYFLLTNILILIFINTAFYITTRNTLEEHQMETIQLTIKNVKTSIDATTHGESFFNVFMAEHLRKASISIQDILPSKIDQVRNEDLVKLSERLDLEGISLLVKEDNDIVVEKSSSPEEIGLSTNDWGIWYQMFNQLFADEEVRHMEGFGEKLKNFWSSPIDNRTATPSLITKFGYYHDGRTDYIINTYIKEDVIKAYNKEAGVDSSIEKMILSTSSLIEVAVLSSDVLKSGEQPIIGYNVVWYTDRLLVYGEDNYKSKKDETYMLKAMKNKEQVNKIMEIKGSKVFKSYVPVTFKNEGNFTEDLVIVVSMDYGVLEDALKVSTYRILLISIMCLIVGYFFILYLMRIINKKEKTIFNIQDMYAKHTENLFKSVKEHRHDFNHHLSTIAGLEKIGLHNELREYVDNLLNFQIEINDIIDVNIPAFSGLLQAKVTEATERNIKFEHYFEKFELLQLDMLKVTDLVRVIGNLIDNAIHAVIEKGGDNRRIVITGRYQTGIMFINIYDNGIGISEEDLSKIFNRGFTTRKDKGGNGLGLVSSKNIIQKYKGTISVTCDKNWTRFSVKLPILPKEVIPVIKK